MRRKIKQVMNKKGEEYMVKIKMMPLCGIEVNDSSIIEFGQSRKDLINILGKGDAEIEDRIYYFENSFPVWDKSVSNAGRGGYFLFMQKVRG